MKERRAKAIANPTKKLKPMQKIGGPHAPAPAGAGVGPPASPTSSPPAKPVTPGGVVEGAGADADRPPATRGSATPATIKTTEIAASALAQRGRVRLARGW